MLRNEHGKAVGIQEFEAIRITRKLAHEGGKVVSPTHRLPLLPKIFLVPIYVRDCVDLRATLRPEGLRR